MRKPLKYTIALRFVLGLVLICQVQNVSSRSLRCPTEIPNMHDPVCGINGKTYINKWALEAINCKNGDNVTVAYTGKCYEEATQIGVHPSSGAGYMDDLQQQTSRPAPPFRNQANEFASLRMGTPPVPEFESETHMKFYIEASTILFKKLSAGIEKPVEYVSVLNEMFRHKGLPTIDVPKHYLDTSRNKFMKDNTIPQEPVSRLSPSSPNNTSSLPLILPSTSSKPISTTTSPSLLNTSFTPQTISDNHQQGQNNQTSQPEFESETHMKFYIEASTNLFKKLSAGIENPVEYISAMNEMFRHKGLPTIDVPKHYLDTSRNKFMKDNTIPQEPVSRHSPSSPNNTSSFPLIPPSTSSKPVSSSTLTSSLSTLSSLPSTSSKRVSSSTLTSSLSTLSSLISRPSPSPQITQNSHIQTSTNITTASTPKHHPKSPSLLNTSSTPQTTSDLASPITSSAAPTKGPKKRPVE